MLTYFKRNIVPSVTPYKEVKNIGIHGIPLWISKKYHRHLYSHPEPTSIWEKDWDLLIILDACRVDWIEEVSGEYPFLDSIETIWSIGGHSKEWLDKTFKTIPQQTLSDTAYICANHNSGRIDHLPFAVLDDLGSGQIEDEFPIAPAHVVTDRAVSIGRSGDFERVIVHYMQPHKPFFKTNSDRYDVTMEDWSVGWGLYNSFLSGNRTKKDVRRGFIKNLRYVLEEVSLLLDNFDAPTTVISADHGNALGESLLWDHHIGVQHPSIREVPWVITSASDKMTLSPKKYSKSELSEDELENRLKQLGYA